MFLWYILFTVLHGDVALSRLEAFARCRAYCEGYSRIAYVKWVVDNLDNDGARYRTVSGWKHSSTKVTLAGVIHLKSRFILQNQFSYISIGSGTVFYFFMQIELL